MRGRCPGQPSHSEPVAGSVTGRGQWLCFDELRKKKSGLSKRQSGSGKEQMCRFLNILKVVYTSIGLTRPCAIWCRRNILRQILWNLLSVKLGKVQIVLRMRFRECCWLFPPMKSWHAGKLQRGKARLRLKRMRRLIRRICVTRAFSGRKGSRSNGF